MQFPMATLTFGQGETCNIVEGIINVFRDTGKILIQTLNLQSFAEAIAPHLPSSSS
jgi:uncharacterized protein (AIM24 family)